MPKKIILSVFVLCTSLSFLCAHNESSDRLFEKGARFEKEGEIVYALGAYYDAIKANPYGAQKAYEAFMALSRSIEDGNLGKNADDDELGLYEDWMALLKNAEKYWTEYFPYQIKLNGIKPGKIDYKSKTGEVMLSVEVSTSEKYERIIGSILKGLKAVANPEWPELSLGDDGQVLWPYYSVSGFFDNLTQITKDRYEVPENDSANDYIGEGVAVFVPYDTDTGDLECNYEYITRPQNSFVASFGSHFLYDFEISLVDADGKAYDSVRVSPVFDSDSGLKKEYASFSLSAEFLFSGLSSKELSLVKNGKISPVLSGVFLKYGRPTTLGFAKAENEDDISFLRNLPEIALNTDCVSVLGMEDNEAANRVIERMRKIAEISETNRKIASALAENPSQEVRENSVFDIVRIDPESSDVSSILDENGNVLAAQNILALLNEFSADAPFELSEKDGKVYALRKNAEKTQELLLAIAEEEARILAEKKAREEAVLKKNTEVLLSVISGMSEEVRGEEVFDVVKIDKSVADELKNPDGEVLSVPEILSMLDGLSPSESGESFSQELSDGESFYLALRLNQKKTQSLAEEKAREEARILAEKEAEEARIAAEKKALEEVRLRRIARGKKIFADVGITFSQTGENSANLNVAKGSFADRRLKVKSGVLLLDQIILNVDSKCRISYGVITGAESKVTFDDFFYEVGIANHNVGILDYPKEGKSFFIDF